MSVRIEFTQKTEKRQQGEVVVVDENSAKHFVDEAKVAKYLDVAEPAPSPVDPAPVETVDGVPVEPTPDTARKTRGA